MSPFFYAETIWAVFISEGSVPIAIEQLAIRVMVGEMECFTNNTVVIFTP